MRTPIPIHRVGDPLGTRYGTRMADVEIARAAQIETRARALTRIRALVVSDDKARRRALHKVAGRAAWLAFVDDRYPYRPAFDSIAAENAPAEDSDD